MRVRPPYSDIFPFDDVDSDTDINFSESGELETESEERSLEEKEDDEEDESCLHKIITVDVYGAGIIVFKKEDLFCLSKILVKGRFCNFLRREASFNPILTAYTLLFSEIASTFQNY